MTEGPLENIHSPVLLDETVDSLQCRDGGTYIDATVGLGGHSEKILHTANNVRLIAIDQDADALDAAKARLEKVCDNVTYVNSNFSAITSILDEFDVGGVDGIIADLGVSSLHLDRPERGFSFRFDAPLDMRMNPASGDPTAAELLETLSEKEIADIIYRYGEERFSRSIARRIVRSRETGEPVKTTKQLAGIVERSVRRKKNEKIHPATKTFQALRIAVNKELEVLENFLNDGIDVLKTEGRFAVITFHSLEDRIVKQAFQRFSGKCSCPPRMPICICGAVKKVEIVTRKPITPSEDEIQKNPRSRSAKLRVVRRIADQTITP
ncbi:MAG TPA: 16S rRNA (cytosine(1402)-N(4))-methyltransferase RsmH [Pyrinomonadaceae bacterium]|nr:16S rRNA (cytosine(1402)-N(4))-methyltransferase RsmH [Pyrinomonadaceae bacterium]